jgi:hypothetical protein
MVDLGHGHKCDESGDGNGYIIPGINYIIHTFAMI